MAYTILVVDDHKFSVGIIEYHLIRSGHQVLKAYDGNIALQIVKESRTRINLIIANLHMPKMSGIEFANALKEMKVTKIPIILTTSDEDIKCQFTKDKKFQIFEDLLIKPISVKQMYNKINCAVQRAKQKLWEYT